MTKILVYGDSYVLFRFRFQFTYQSYVDSDVAVDVDGFGPLGL